MNLVHQEEKFCFCLNSRLFCSKLGLYFFYSYWHYHGHYTTNTTVTATYADTDTEVDDDADTDTITTDTNTAAAAAAAIITTDYNIKYINYTKNICTPIATATTKPTIKSKLNTKHCTNTDYMYL